MPDRDKKVIPFEPPRIDKETLPPRAKFLPGTAQKDLGEVVMQEVGDFLYIVQGDQRVRLSLNDLFRNQNKIDAFKSRHR